MKLRRAQAPDQGPPNSTLSWCPLCGDVVSVRFDFQPVDYEAEERSAMLHMQHQHKVRFQLWKLLHIDALLTGALWRQRP